MDVWFWFLQTVCCRFMDTRQSGHIEWEVDKAVLFSDGVNYSLLKEPMSHLWLRLPQGTHTTGCYRDGEHMVSAKATVPQWQCFREGACCCFDCWELFLNFKSVHGCIPVLYMLYLLFLSLLSTCRATSLYCVSRLILCKMWHLKENLSNNTPGCNVAVPPSVQVMAHLDVLLRFVTIIWKNVHLNT